MGEFAPHVELVFPQPAAGYEVDFLLRGTLDVVAKYSDPPVPLTFDEWNTYLRGKSPLFIDDYNLADALSTGTVMNASLNLCDRIKISTSFNFVNVMANFRVTLGSVWKTPATLVMDLLTKNRGQGGIDCQVKSPIFSSPAIEQQYAYDDVPTLNAAATYDLEHGVVYLSIINNDQEQSAALYRLKDLNGTVQTSCFK